MCVSDPTVGAGDTAANKTDTSALVHMPITINAERFYFSRKENKKTEKKQILETMGTIILKR